MRFRRLVQRCNRRVFVAAVFMAGLYLGRLTYKFHWFDFVCVACYLLNTIMAFLPLHRENKRQEAELRQLMQDTARLLRRDQQ